MPFIKRKRPTNSKITERERSEVIALAMDGEMSKAAIGRQYGISARRVSQLAQNASDIDPAHVVAVRRSLPNLFSILAAEHVMSAMQNVHTDPATAVKSTFGAKLAVEATRSARPEAEAPGVTILNFIQRLDVTPTVDRSETAKPVFDVGVSVEPPGDGAVLAELGPPPACGGVPETLQQELFSSEEGAPHRTGEEAEAGREWTGAY